MSRKTIAIQIPQKAEAAPAPGRSIEKKPPAAEQWISQSEAPAPVFEVKLAEAKPVVASGAAGYTIVLPAEPDVFDLVRIGLVLPYATAGLWTFGAARKGFRLFAR
jgi:hypothetical protein